MFVSQRWVFATVTNVGWNLADGVGKGADTCGTLARGVRTVARSPRTVATAIRKGADNVRNPATRPRELANNDCKWAFFMGSDSRSRRLHVSLICRSST